MLRREVTCVLPFQPIRTYRSPQSVTLSISASYIALTPFVTHHHSEVELTTAKILNSRFRTAEILQDVPGCSGMFHVPAFIEAVEV